MVTMGKEKYRGGAVGGTTLGVREATRMFCKTWGI